MGSIHDLFRRNGLTRPPEGGILGGVCAGLGRRLGLDPWPARLLFFVVLLLIPGSQLLVYPALWIGVVLARGATDGWVPYPFLDPKHGYGAVAAICAVLAAGFVLIGLVLRLADRVPLRPATPAAALT